MALDADLLIDRRRLKRRLVLWRVAALLAALALGLGALAEFTDLRRTDYVARITVEGVIAGDADLWEALDRVADDGRARALIVRIDSPGGSVTGGETLYRRLSAVGRKKPVVAVLDSLATSAGYMAALAAERIFAQQSTVTGSIGVVMQTADVTGLLAKLGISAEAIKSRPLKGVPSPLEPLSPAAREATQAVVLDMFDMFVELVAERRRLGRERALALADGRIFTGRQAVANGLVDEIGDETEARAWLKSRHDLDPSLPARDVTPEDFTRRWAERLPAGLGKVLFSERLRLDGLVSLWHPGFD
ncbi:MAG: signal peptide peptidase SppA [Proteobacteria bacterium]|nr:signal peptide peptidase SppA [Pseudomonadota bacterium]